MVFLHASPNILKDKDKIKNKAGLQAVVALDFIQEEDVIKETIRHSGKKVTFRASVATKMAFQQTIYDAPDILHISCHGFNNAPHQYLLFENEYGGGDMVSDDSLGQLIESA